MRSVVAMRGSNICRPDRYWAMPGTPFKLINNFIKADVPCSGFQRLGGASCQGLGSAGFGFTTISALPEYRNSPVALKEPANLWY